VTRSVALTRARKKKGIFVFGGSQEGLVYPSEVHFFNIETNTWEDVKIANAGPSHRIGASGVIHNHKFYLYGGAVWDRVSSCYLESFDEMWCLDLHDDVWKWHKLTCWGTSPGKDELPVNHTCVVLGNHFLVEGCSNGNYNSYLFDTVTNTWTKLNTRNQNTSNFGEAVLVGSKVYYLCGYRGYRHAKDVLKLDLEPISKFIEHGIIPPEGTLENLEDTDMKAEDDF